MEILIIGHVCESLTLEIIPILWIRTLRPREVLFYSRSYSYTPDTLGPHPLANVLLSVFLPPSFPARRTAHPCAQRKVVSSVSPRPPWVDLPF